MIRSDRDRIRMDAKYKARFGSGICEDVRARLGEGTNMFNGGEFAQCIADQ